MSHLTDLWRKIISSTYWSRGSSYVNNIHDIHYKVWDTAIQFSATIVGTEHYETSFDIDLSGIIATDCTCLAHTTSRHCKHVAALIRAVDRDYVIDFRRGIIEEKYPTRWQNHTTGSHNLQSTPEKTEWDPDLWEIRPSAKKYLPRQLNLNDNSVLSLLWDMWGENIFQPKTPTEKKTKSWFDILHTDAPDETDVPHRIKISLTKAREKNLFLHLFRAKHLKKWWLSTGVEVHRYHSLREDERKYETFLPFRTSYSYEPETQWFREIPESFIRLLTHTDTPITWYDNSPLEISSQVLTISLALTHDIESRTYTLKAIFSNGYKIDHAKPEFIIAPDAPYGAIIEKKRILFFTSHLPREFLLPLLEKSITITDEEWQKNRSHPGWARLIESLDDIRAIDDECVQGTPNMELGIEIPDTYDTIRIEPFLSYDGITIGRARTSPYIITEKCILQRDLSQEERLFQMLTPLKQMCDEEDDGWYTRFIGKEPEEDNIFFDLIESIGTQESITLTYRQKTKRVYSSLRTTIDVTSGIDWFDLDIHVALWQRELEDLSDFLSALRRKNGKHITLEDGTIIQLKEQAQKALSTLTELAHGQDIHDNTIRTHKNIIGLFEDDKKWGLSFTLPKEVKKLKKSLEDFSAMPDAPMPPSATVTLRDYQKHGYSWLHFLRSYRFHGILADDMWLGKTIQTLVYLESISAPSRSKKKTPLQKHLIVVPTSLLLNWLDEAKKFTPELKIEAIRDGKSFHTIAQDTEVVVISYGVLTNLVRENILDHISWNTIILDEAQNIKNAKNERSKAISTLVGTHRLALSGTPIENHLGELYSIFSFLMPWFLGSYRQFQERYMSWWENQSLMHLARKVKPFILRRTKESVLTELPPKQEEVIFLEMSPEQRELYDKLKKIYTQEVREQMETLWLAKSTFIVLDALLKLRQACLCPALLKTHDHQDVPSIKLQYLEENLEEILTQGHSVLIFSQFTEFLWHIRKLLEKQNIAYLSLDGSTRAPERKRLVDEFNRGAVKIFLISLKAGGTGLNLTGADTVIHMDPWWNPAVENQATDRAHRMGQEKTVFVKKLIVRGSIEEKILELQERKKWLINELFSGDFRGKLDKDDIDYIFE